MRRHIHITLAATALICTGTLSSCFFTGIENTGHIKLSKDDIKAVTSISAEEKLMTQAPEPQPMHQWKEGKSFLAASPRVRLIFLRAEVDPYGDTLYYTNSVASRTPAGRDAVNITFRDSEGHTFVYSRELPEGRDISSSDIPMLIDLDMVNDMRKLLQGATLWPHTRIWDSVEPTQESLYTSVTAFQLMPVHVDNIVPGTPDFPCRVIFTADDKRRGSLLFSPRSDSSRSFASQFMIEDPRPRYSHIAEDKWVDICNGRLSQGMTKEEARLSQGAPDDIRSGHDYSKLLENWYYANGTFLHFEDGLLVNFRH